MYFYPLCKTLQRIHERSARTGKVDAEKGVAFWLAVDCALRKLDFCLVFQPCGKRSRIEAKRSHVHPSKIRRLKRRDSQYRQSRTDEIKQRPIVAQEIFPKLVKPLFAFAPCGGGGDKAKRIEFPRAVDVQEMFDPLAGRIVFADDGGCLQPGKVERLGRGPESDGGLAEIP